MDGMSHTTSPFRRTPPQHPTHAERGAETRRSGKEVLSPAPPPLRTGRAPFRCIRLKHETTHWLWHAVNLLGLEATCTVREPSRLPMCFGGGSRTSKDRYGPADISALLPNAG